MMIVRYMNLGLLDVFRGLVCIRILDFTLEVFLGRGDFYFIVGDVFFKLGSFGGLLVFSSALSCCLPLPFR